MADRVELIEGAALEVLHRLQGPFDLAYVDAVKTEYRRYLDLLCPSLRVGGLVVCDNLLWSGRVAAPPEDGGPTDADALRAFNGYLMMHPQLQAVVLPLGDGLGVATKIEADHPGDGRAVLSRVWRGRSSPARAAVVP